MLKHNYGISSHICIKRPISSKAQSPHRIASTMLYPIMNTSPNLANNSSSKKDVNSAQKQTVLYEAKSPNKKFLTLDDSLFENEPHTQMTDKILQKQNKKKTAKPIPTNPFEQILNQTDTPDFNLSLPYVDGFSQIDLKSPTYSDIFTMSQIKSPQFKNQNHHFFMTARKKNHESKQDFTQTVKVGNCFTKDQKEEKFIEKIQTYSHETKNLNDKYSLGTNKKNDLNKIFPDYKKLSSGFKLKNHFNLSTPKITKIPIIHQNQSKNLPKNDQIYFSAESNPEQEGRLFNSIAITVVKTPKIYKFSQKNKQTQKVTSFQKNDGEQDLQSLKDQKKDFFRYKVNIPKKDLKEEMEEIYKGKFKLQKTNKS